jgi:hypothetical protein
MRSALLCILCFVTSDSDPVEQYFQGQQEWFRHDHLKHKRWAIAVLEKNIASMDNAASWLESIGETEMAKFLRKEAQSHRRDLVEWRKLERELWEQQPGGITAPAPRPVSR